MVAGVAVRPARPFAGAGEAPADAFAWGVAWSTLGLGGLLGPLATWRLQRASAPRPSG